MKPPTPQSSVVNAQSQPPLLELHACSIHFGGLAAVQDFNLTLRKGELVGLIGPNGAGKTTIFNMITGVYRPSQGTICFRHVSLTKLKPYQTARLGIARTFQNIRLFRDMSVEDNIKAACIYRFRYPSLNAVLGTRVYATAERHIQQATDELLELFHLTPRRRLLAKNLPYGDQRRLEIARALATHPELLLLDEPTAGMNPVEKDGIIELIHSIRDRFNLTVLLIEHDMRLVMNHCERLLVLDEGHTICTGAPAQVQKDPKVIEAYLGAAD